MSRRRATLAAVVALLALALALAGVAPAPGVAAVPTEQASDRVVERAGTYTVTGRVVRFSTGRPVSGVRVSATNASETEVVGSDLTDARGRFVIRGVQADDNEFGIYVRGARVGYQNGWLGCDGTVKPTFGDACTHSSPTGPIRIKKG